MWLYVKPMSKLHCAACAATVDIGVLEMYVDPVMLESGRLLLTCDCGAPLTTDDFMQAGAQLMRSPRINRESHERNRGQDHDAARESAH